LLERIAELPSAVCAKPGDISLQLDRNGAVEAARDAILTLKFEKQEKARLQQPGF
jgi:hypothetical protein